MNMSSFQISIAVALCVLVTISQGGVSAEETDCDCGPNSNGCKFENGEKICDCEVRFRQENGVCKAWCSWDYTCKNGAKCVNEKCQCLPGTHGGFCEIIDECEGEKGPYMCGDPEKVLCRYDEKTQKPYCMCRYFDYIYYPKIRDCVECDCGKFGSCTLIDGKKTCKCNKGASLKKVDFWGDVVERCAECDCGENSNGCSFEGKYDKICDCKKGFAQQPDLYGDKCNACNCGPHGECYFRGWYQKCKCEDGYKPYLNKDRTKLTCEACDCGEHGTCYFEEEVKKCNCPPGYTVKDGSCSSV